MLFLVFNFFQKDIYGFLVAPFSVVYVGILGLYVGTKEFDRWYEMHEGRHPGERFVIAWTILVFALLLLSIIFKESYKIPSEAITDYIVVLSIFALTQKSKRLYQRKIRRR